MLKLVLPASVVTSLLLAACQNVPNNTATKIEIAPEKAMYQQALLVQSAPNGVPDLTRAKELLEKAAEAGSDDAMDRLGDMYMDGEGGVARDVKTALDWYKREADLSEKRPGAGAWGQIKTGLAYETGLIGLNKSSLEADEWYKKAVTTARTGASRGEGSAMTAMGYLLAYGKGVKEDDVQAWNWAIKAIGVDEARARSLMADLFGKGQGVAVDDEEAFKCSLRAAQLGVVDEMVETSLGFIYGDGAPVDSPAGLEWAQKAIDRGSSRAMRVMGNYYHEGRGIARNDETARMWYQKAIDLKDPAALGYMGRLVAQRDVAGSVQWYKDGDAAGDPASRYWLAMIYLDPTGTNLAKDSMRAGNLLRSAAEADYGKAMTRLGQLQEEGIGMPASAGGALSWYRRAAAVEDEEGMYRLGLMLAGRIFGNGNIPAGYPEAKNWLIKSANAGYGPAMTLLGRIYSRGVGGSKQDRDPLLAARWFERGARTGEAESMREYGELLVEGKYASRDFAGARQWFDRAQQRGDTYALIDLGTVYEKGQGVEIDYDAAMQCYVEADKRGEPAAKAAIGHLYQDGLGVKADPKMAIKLFLEGLAANDVSAAEALAQTYEFGKGELIDNVKTRDYYKRAEALGSDMAAQWLSWHPEVPTTGPALTRPSTLPGGARPGRGGSPFTR